MRVHVYALHVCCLVQLARVRVYEVMDEIPRGEDIRQRQRWSEELHSESDCVTASDSEALVSAVDETGRETTSPDGSAATGGVRRIWSLLRSWFGSAIVLATPLLLLPLPIVIGNSAANAAYVILIVAVYWVTEACPIVITALLPLVLFPVLGVLTAEQASEAYLTDANMLFVGGLMVAVSVEKWDLHKRISLWVLLLVGSRPMWLLFGFMGTTAFLSMWLSNTATAAMMLPIAQAVLKELGKCSDAQSPVSTTAAPEGGPLEGAVTTVSYRRTFPLSEAAVIPHEDDPDSAHEQNGPLVGVAGSEEEEEGEGVVITENPAPVPSPGDGDQGERNGASTERDGRSDVGSAAISQTAKRFGKGLMIGVAFAANIGGIATLTGTGPNLVLRGDVAKLFNSEEAEINFGLWFAFGFPTAVMVLVVTWGYLAAIFCDDTLGFLKRRICRKMTISVVNRQKGRAVIKEQYRKLGPMKYAEVLVLLMFVLLAVLWFSRDPKFIPGWEALLHLPKTADGRSYVSDSTTAIFVVFLLFIIPSQSCCACRNCRKAVACKSDQACKPCDNGKFVCTAQGCIAAGRSDRLLDWNTVHHKLPWNVVLLLGSGFALARGAQCSGLSKWIGESLHSLDHVPPSALAFLVSCLVSMVTQVVSNVATTTLFLPILAQLAQSLAINPLYLMIPATVAASLAFMLPVATPPNAIAFSYGFIKVHEMALTGLLVNLMSIGILNFAVNTYGAAIFGLNDLPPWAGSAVLGNSTNTTALVNC